MREPSDYWTEIAERFAALGRDAALIGALAAALYRATPRATTDADFLIDSLDGVAEAFEAEGFEVETMAEPGGEPYLAFVRGDGIRVDILVAETDYQREALRRANGTVITVEDVIVHKLIAWRARDRDDIDQILAAGHALDIGYVERWVAAWAVADRWEEIRMRTGT